MKRGRYFIRPHVSKRGRYFIRRILSTGHDMYLGGGEEVGLDCRFTWFTERKHQTRVSAEFDRLNTFLTREGGIRSISITYDVQRSGILTWLLDFQDKNREFLNFLVPQFPEDLDTSKTPSDME